MKIELFFYNIKDRKSVMNPNPPQQFRLRQYCQIISAGQIAEIWNKSDCTCTNGSTDRECPLNQIIYVLRRCRSFKTFRKVVKQVSSIARSKPEKQTRKNHLRYISKCNSGPFYRIMKKRESIEVKNAPHTYVDSDSTAVCEISEDSATE